MENHDPCNTNVLTQLQDCIVYEAMSIKYLIQDSADLRMFLYFAFVDSSNITGETKNSICSNLCIAEMSCSGFRQ